MLLRRLDIRPPLSGVDAPGATTSLRLIKMDVYAGAGRSLRGHPATVAPPLCCAEPLAVGQGARASAGAVKSCPIVSCFREAGLSLVKALMRRPLPRCSTCGPQVSKSDIKLSAKRATTGLGFFNCQKGQSWQANERWRLRYAVVAFVEYDGRRK